MWLYWFAKIVWFIPNAILFPAKFFNKKKLPKGKCIIACNHLSGWDPIVLISNFSRPVSYMIKASLYKNGFLRYIFKIFGCVKAKRDGRDFSAIREALDVLEEGKAFGLFPEGTRNYKDPDHIQQFKNGLALFALKSHAPVIPVIIKRKMRPFRMNYIVMGDPIDLSEFYTDNVTSDVIAKTTEKIWNEMNKIQDDFNRMLAEKYPKKFTYTERAVEIKAAATDQAYAPNVKYKAKK